MKDAPLVLLDTTVFCGALVKPDGLNMRILEDTPLRIILSKLTSAWPVKDVGAKLNLPLKKIDPGDLHIALAVLQYSPDILVTSNLSDLMFLNGICNVLPPNQFLKSIDAL